MQVMSFELQALAEVQRKLFAKLLRPEPELGKRLVHLDELLPEKRILGTVVLENLLGIEDQVCLEFLLKSLRLQNQFIDSIDLVQKSGPQNGVIFDGLFLDHR